DPPEILGDSYRTGERPGGGTVWGRRMVGDCQCTAKSSESSRPTSDRPVRDCLGQPAAVRDGDGPTGRIGAHVLPWQRSDVARRLPEVDSSGPRLSRTGGNTR